MGRKQAMMPTMSGRGSGARVITTLIALGLLVLVLRDPVGAAHAVQQLARWGGSGLDGLTAFGAALSK